MMKDVIIDRPSLQTARQHFIYGSLTLLFWVLWIYLWLPLLALAGWYLGFHLAYEEMVVKHGFDALKAMLVTYAIVVAYLGGSLLVWAYYNFFRFHGVERRVRRTPVSGADQAGYYQLDPAMLGRWVSARRLVVHHDAAGKIVSADP
jgi:biofilm PGA synthesis protein PgaD